MCRIVKRVTLATYLGVIPFYFSWILESFPIEFILTKLENFNNFSNFYCSIIVAFLSGMQWEKMINHNRKNQLFIPFIPLFMVLTFNQNFFSHYAIFILTFSLVFSLLIDVILLKDILDDSFKKLRVNATFLALLSFCL